MKKNVLKSVGFADAFRTLIESHKELQEIREYEKTKRAESNNRTKVSIEEIRAKKEVLIAALKNDHEINKEKLKYAFKAIDKALEDKDLNALGMGLSAMIKIAETSSLLNLSALTKQLEDPNNVIDI